ncbi:MAG TPA: hypothetical protein VHZ95_20940 [Polyangiales bacterium]|nr:hypothetical protein [Polyangiales bacterium]
MGTDVTSRHICGVSELLLSIPVKPGFVDGGESLMSYATRLQQLLNGLSEPLRIAAEIERLPSVGPVDRLQTIFNTQWAVVERPGESQLIVSAVFDRSWEEYFHILVDQVGPLLDAIFCHCLDYENHTCLDGYENFADWIRRHQLQTSFFHTGLSDVTLDDIRALRAGAGFTATPPLAAVAEETLRSHTAQLTQLARRLVLDSYEFRSYFPDIGEASGARTAQSIFDDAMFMQFQTQGVFALSLDLPAPIDAWLSQLGSRPAVPNVQVELSDRDLEDIQGNLLTRYDIALEGRIVLVQCDGPAAAATLLRRLLEIVEPESGRDHARNPVKTNVAITYAGLRRLGLPEDLYALLPSEFREGMEARSALIGDVGAPNHPEFWQEPRNGDERLPLAMVDFILILQGGTRADHEVELGKLIDHDSVRILSEQLLQRTPNSKGEPLDHFGLRDNGEPSDSSQPIPNVRFAGRDLRANAAPRDLVALGELLLGYQDARGQVARCADRARNPEYADLFYNGTFLVLRKLTQDVAAFDAFVAENGKAKAISGALGRDTVGNPLIAPAAPADRRQPNDFDYETDKDGAICPLHAHIRRANPRSIERVSFIPRILRRGFSYGPEQDQQCGLMFMAYNANIGAQFEVIQRWLNGGNSTGLFSRYNDVLTGTPSWTRAIPGSRGATLQPPRKPLIELRWGVYAFVPSLRGIAKLAKLIDDSQSRPLKDDPQLVATGKAWMAGLDAIADRATAKAAWRRLLEEDQSRPLAAAVWAAIRAEGRAKATPYGVLVGDLVNAQYVLANDGRQFSVREYWHRLSESIGEHYLGLDPVVGKLSAVTHDPRDVRFEQRAAEVSYRDRSRLANQFIERISGEKAYQHALDFTRQFIRKQSPSRIELTQLAKWVVAQLSNEWIGLPASAQDDEAMIHLIEQFVLVSRCTFQPYPSESLLDRSRLAGSILQEAYAAKPRLPPMAAKLDALSDHDADVAAIGAIVGFAPPAIGCVVSVLGQWLASGALQGWRVLLQSANDDERRRQLQAPLIEALTATPVPPILYRTCIEPFAGGAAGEFVVIGLSSVVVDARTRGLAEPWPWLFGGEHGGAVDSSRPVHGCPGRNAAFEALVGVIAAVLDCDELEADGPFAFSFTPKPSGTKSAKKPASAAKRANAPRGSRATSCPVARTHDERSRRLDPPPMAAARRKVSRKPSV